MKDLCSDLFSKRFEKIIHCGTQEAGDRNGDEICSQFFSRRLHHQRDIIEEGKPVQRHILMGTLQVLNQFLSGHLYLQILAVQNSRQFSLHTWPFLRNGY